MPQVTAGQTSEAIGSEPLLSGSPAAPLGPAGGPFHGNGGSAYWRSLDELADTPQFRTFVEREFASYAPELLTSPTRRQFMKIMGASLAMAGIAGCRWPKENILPFAKRPPGRTPGLPVHYATAMECGGVGTGLLVTTYDGRPTKIEGNPEHPFSKGRTNSQQQAAILNLYDPDRSGAVRQAGKELKPEEGWGKFESFARATFGAARSARGGKVAVLAEPSLSPTFVAVRERFLTDFADAAWVEYEPAGRANEKAGIAMAFGRPLRPHYSFARAEVVLSLDSDFLTLHATAVRNMLEFCAQRTGAHDAMNRLLVVESEMSLTGGMADKRYIARPSEVGLVAARIAGELAKHGSALPDGALSALPSTLPDQALGRAGKAAPQIRAQDIAAIATELAAKRGKSIIIAGERQPAEVHALAHALNAALDNIGHTVTYTEEPVAPQSDVSKPGDEFGRLVERMKAGEIETLLILGGNPVYDAPADLDFGAALEKVKNSVHLSHYFDETSQKCAWHLPRAHFLESWGDVRAWDGLVSIVQPLIEPLLHGRSCTEVLALCAGDQLTSGYELTRRTFEAQFKGDRSLETAWQHALHDGVISGTAWPPQAPGPLATDWASALAARLGGARADNNTFEISFRPDYKVHDGRYANNAWLQELPDPITKITWDSAALISPADAERMGLRRDDVVTVSLGGRNLDLPVCPSPGHAPGSIVLLLGYGRQLGGVVARGAGFNVYPLRTRALRDYATGARMTATGRRYKLATTQDHHAMQSNVGTHETEHRAFDELFLEESLSAYVAAGGAAHAGQEHGGDGHAGNGHAGDVKSHEPRHESGEDHRADAHGEHVALPIIGAGPAQPDYNLLWQEFSYPDYKWGMLIDLSKCTGCSACVVACQAENNIPVVGKGEVALGREMHWIRVDRYYKGDPVAPTSLAVQPVPCMHCENAPCESVCPVAATVHDADGLNVMVYNRCIGTRYCSNNCPYKVRRFNWFWNHHGPKHPRRRDELTELEKMQMNPDVTVRSRGVMEKCTYCVQRLNHAKINAKNEVMRRLPEWEVASKGDGVPQMRPLLDEEAIVPACAQACPADAIIFGDLNDRRHRVTQLFADKRRYGILNGLNTQPRTQYMKRLRNVSASEQGGHAPAAHAGHAG